MTYAIELTGVSKRYWKVAQRPTLLRSLLPIARPQREELWAVRDVNLRIEVGETVGILGRNGAGKTTLLRLLAGVAGPTLGEVVLRGRIAPLLSVGVGFHHEMSGRENVYVNGMLLGLTRTEVSRHFAEIVEFAELGDFIDSPVKFYSSGMFMRLGFSVAIHVNPDLLLVDEVLAVGDVAFQLKCYQRMRALQQAGTTIVLVSHSMHAIRLLCPRVLLFRQGQLVADGPSEDVVAQYHHLLSADGEAKAEGGAVSTESVELVDDLGEEVLTVRPDQRLTLRIGLRFHRPIESPQLLFQVMGLDETLAYAMRTVLGERHRTFAAGDQTAVEVTFIPRLVGGTYRLRWAVLDADGREEYLQERAGRLIYLAPQVGSLGVAALDAQIEFDGDMRSNYPPLTLGRAKDQTDGDAETR